MTATDNAAAKRRYLYKQQRGRCHWCKCSLRSLEDAGMDTAAAPTLDHLIPKSKGGGGGIKNLVVACRECNEMRGNLSIMEFLAVVKWKAPRATPEPKERARMAPQLKARWNWEAGRWSVP